MYLRTKMTPLLYSPDTAELLMRFGLHSGPVTAGVLRGEKCRFQLFGDTVNTAARIEETGESNMIHVSQTTSDLLMAAGKSEWLTQREHLVPAKGKGEIQTYWLAISGKQHKSKAQRRLSSTHSIKSESIASGDGISSRGDDDGVIGVAGDAKTERLVDWNVEVLQSQLKKIVAMRDGNLSLRRSVKDKSSSPKFDTVEGNTVLDEVLEVIPLSNQAKEYKISPSMVELDSEVVSQLKSFVCMVAALYRDNPFHNFEHASHVSIRT